jgi:hypothetical protein
MNYIFTSRGKTICFVLMAIGIISIIASFATGSSQAWSNLLWNNFFFTVIALSATFFLAVKYAAEAGWAPAVKRVAEAIGLFLPYGAVLMLVILIGNYIAGHSSHHFLYEWWNPELYKKTLENGQPNPEYDEIIAGKSGFLNLPFFFIRVVSYFVIWVGFMWYFRKQSLKLDEDGSVDRYLKMRTASYRFLVLFAITSSLMAWDFIMSIETHWFSTLFGWYTFAGLWVSGISVIAITTVLLKKKGYLEHVNEHHLHNLGLMIFAFSVFWTYLWFAQFMLIWYANLPEEITYFMVRQDQYRILWIGNFFINFFTPFLFLMSRDAKRKPNLLLTVAIIVFIGHWIDEFQKITPGIAHEHWHLGWMEIGTALGFLGLFMFVVQKELAKAPLLVKNEPFLGESLQHTL